MSKRILAVFAHPDDEAFGPAGTLARYADEGVEIHLLCATRGEAGQNNIKYHPPAGGSNIGNIRERELLKSAKILGLKKVEFLDYIDGMLCNALYHQIADKIMKKIKSFKPQIIITYERRGVSGHLDHIAISMITTYSYLHTSVANKLYYHCLSDNLRKSEGRLDDYFVYFPEGYDEKDITTKIDYSIFWDRKVGAMKAHESQIEDVEFILSRHKKRPKIDNFILQFHRGVKVELSEGDLFAGIS